MQKKHHQSFPITEASSEKRTTASRRQCPARSFQIRGDMASSGQWFGVRHRLHVRREADSSDGENNLGKLGMVLDSSDTVHVPRKVHQICGSWPGDGEHGSLLRWVGFDRLRRFKLQPFFVGCFGSLHSEMLLERDTCLDWYTEVPHRLLWTPSHVSLVIYSSHSQALNSALLTYLCVCICCVIFQGMLRGFSYYSLESWGGGEATSCVQQVFRTWEMCCCFAFTSQVTFVCSLWRKHW